jgi:hypothetical protein
MGICSSKKVINDENHFIGPNGIVGPTSITFIPVQDRNNIINEKLQNLVIIIPNDYKF